jgi:hypothetical protein
MTFIVILLLVALGIYSKRTLSQRVLVYISMIE